MIIVDVETGGLDPKKNPLLSIGAVEYENPDNRFYVEMRALKEEEATEMSMKINGFTREQIYETNQYSLEEGIMLFVDWYHKCGERTIGGENPRFDTGFIQERLDNLGTGLRLGYRTIDLHTLSYVSHLANNKIIPRKDGRTDLNLDKTLEYCGMPEEPSPHNGLRGALLEAEAMARIMEGRNLIKEYKKFKIPEFLTG